VDIALDSEGLAANGVDDWMAIAAQLRIFELKSLDELQSILCCLCFQDVAKNSVQASGAVRSGKTEFQRVNRRYAV
jgi:hypothetical protein